MRRVVESVRARRSVIGLALTVVLACAAVAAFVFAGTAHAAVQFNLTGTWDTYGTGGGYTGTFTISTMDKSTGDFSGTGDSGEFVLKGTEIGTAVHFTQSEGDYVADDDATLDLDNGVLKMVDGNWSDSNGSNGTFTASIAYSGTISGTVTRYGGPLAGVTLDATDNAGDKASATTAADGTYTINLSKLGTWTVTPSGLGLKYHPKDHIVFVTGDSDGVDFDAAGKTTLERDKVIPIPGTGTDLWYRGKDWDPNGGPVSLTFGGDPFGSVTPSATSTIDGKITIPYWPHRLTINNFNNLPRRGCWGEMVATQGSETAKAEFDEKAVGEVIWTLSPLLHNGEVFCETELDSPLFKGPDTITWEFGKSVIDVYNGGQVLKGISILNLESGHHICYSAGSQPVHVILTLTPQGTFHHPTSPGPCGTGAT